MNPLAILRTIGLVEGITTRALFFVAMPLKYGFGFSQAVAVTGMVHGVAFIVYMLAIVPAVWGRNWRVMEIFRTAVAAVFPFGTFINDGFLKKKQALAGQA